jgi:signal transduction histidine kinase
VVLLSVLMSRAVTRQIRELLSAIRRVRAGAYSHRAYIKGHDEIAQIGEEFNSLTDRLQKTEETRRRFVSDASHELKTPLTAIRLLTDSILQTDNMDPAMTREFVADIGHEAERLSRITEDLLLLTRLDSSVLPHADPEDVREVLERVLRMVELLADSRGVTITVHAEDGCLVCSTQDEIQQVIYNLLDNAVKYSRDWGHVEVSLRQDSEWVILTVADNGVGIPVEDLPRIFDRFYRVDKARSREAGGTGLGLSIVRETVKRRKGTITASNRVEGGAIFTVCWPNAGEEDHTV